MPKMTFSFFCFFFLLPHKLNYRTIKLWKYHPEPLKLWEKLGFLGGALFFVLYPIIVEIYGLLEITNSTFQGEITILLGLLIILSTFGGFYFFWVLTKNICPSCVNFSCPLNRVPKEIVDKYLMRNPIMKEAWEASGYIIGNNPD